MVGYFMAESYFQKNLETSEDMKIPLPLTQEQIALLGEEDLTLPQTEDVVRKIYPEINIVPNTKGIIIPIIPGITLYSYLRFFHAYPSELAVDIYVNGRMIVQDVKYREFTEYFKAFPGYYRVAVYETGTKEKPILLTFINLIGYRIYTGAITGLGYDVSLELINDNIRPMARDKSSMRYIQLSANAPIMDAYLDDSLVLEEMEYKEVSRYLRVNTGKHNLKFREYYSGNVLLEDPDVTVDGGKAYSAYVIGDSTDRIGLQVLIEKEGISYLNF